MYKIETKYYYKPDFTNEALDFYEMLEADKSVKVTMFVAPEGIIITKSVDLDDSKYGMYAKANKENRGESEVTLEQE